jgi:hypothetical protein
VQAVSLTAKICASTILSFVIGMNMYKSKEDADVCESITLLMLPQGINQPGFLMTFVMAHRDFSTEQPHCVVHTLHKLGASLEEP